MTSQPEALRLADLLVEISTEVGVTPKQIRIDSSKELRRLHESNTELLEALKDLIADNSSLSMTQHLALYREARAAISKAERTTT